MDTKLNVITKGRDNNLNILRFIAAILVIISHSFPISRGINVMDPLANLTNDQISFGSLAVSVFFLYGGFLICKSMHRLKTAKAYFRTRILRIFPPLCFVTCILTFIIGPIFTKISINAYLTSSQTYRYLLNCFLILQHNLPGGVFENNIYPSVVNGPLWTLPIEFICYIMCFCFYKLNLLDRKNAKFTVIIIIIGCIGADVLSKYVAILSPLIRPVGLFFAGMLYYVYQDVIHISDKLSILCLIGLIVSIYAGIFECMIFFFLPYFLMYIGFATKRKFFEFSIKGKEISYGMYLSAWPIQQIICQLFGGKMNPFVNFSLSIPLAVIAGYIISIFSEKIFIIGNR